jgi:hypothetical protein
MNGFVKVFTIIAATGLAATLVAPQAQTAKVVTSGFEGLTSWQKAAEGR